MIKDSKLVGSKHSPDLSCLCCIEQDTILGLLFCIEHAKMLTEHGQQTVSDEHCMSIQYCSLSLQ